MAHNLMCKVTRARKRNPWVDHDKLLHKCRGPLRNHLCQLLWLSLMGFRCGGGGSYFGFSVELRHRPYYHANLWSFLSLLLFC